jgi:hypothetical protein
MSSGSFGAQTQAIATAASAFDGQADPIIQQAERLESIKGSSTTTGKAYSAQGDAYHQAVTQSLEKVIRTFGEKCLWVSTNLTDTKTGYESADSSGASSLDSAGTGVK